MHRESEITLWPYLGLAGPTPAFHLRAVSPPNVVPPKPRSSLFGGVWAVLSLSPERTAFFFAYGSDTGVLDRRPRWRPLFWRSRIWPAAAAGARCSTACPLPCP